VKFFQKILLKGAELICELLFLAMFGAFLIQIFMRYVAGNPMGWTDELSVLLFIWAVFLANAFMLKDHEHIRFNLIYQKFSLQTKRIITIITAAVFVGLMLAALPVFIDYLNFLKIQRTPILLIPCNLAYSCFVIFIVVVCLKYITKIIRLLGRNWRVNMSESDT
jgi:TRAP-type C4-dicarboxylate transport system permease small subunit